MTFDAKRAMELAEQCEADDKRATPGEWFGDERGWITAPIPGDDRSGSEHEVLTLGEHNRREDIAVAARTRNSLADVAKQLRAAVEEVERLKASHAIRNEGYASADYQAVAENIAHDPRWANRTDSQRVARWALSLLAEREQLRGEVKDAQAAADKMFSALDQALTLADVPEHSQDEDWQEQRRLLGEVCDAYVKFAVAADDHPCKTHPFSSRVCERRTRACIVVHDPLVEPPDSLPSATEGSGKP